MPNRNLDESAVFWGFFFGILAGGIATLFLAPQSGRSAREKLTSAGQTVRGKIETAITSDPVKESIAQGKAAARRRRSELGLDR